MNDENKTTTTNESTTKSKGRKPRRKSQNKRVNSRTQKFDKDVDTAITNKSNDIAWYGKGNGLMEGSARLPFSNTTGFPLPYGNHEGVPGVLAMTYEPCLGASTDVGTGGSGNIATTAANSYYSYVVHANSRNQSYDAPDLFMLTYAGMEALAFIAVGIRAYGIMRLYDQTNRYLPDALLTAMGFDPEDLRQNYSQMLFAINQLIANATQIWIPDTMPLMQRKFWMNSNIYMDSESVKGQYYVFVPEYVYEFSETASEAGTSLVPVKWGNANKHTWAQYTAMATKLIRSLINSQDRGIIFGDILKAYGKEHLYTLTPIPLDYSVTPVYDHEVLTQIENATCGNIPIGNVVQKDGVILQEWVDNTPVAESGNYFPSQSVLNFHFKDTPTQEQIMIATRLKSGYMRGVAGDVITKSYPIATGSEVVTGFAIYYYAGDTLTALYMGNSKRLTVDNIRRWVAFDYAPWLYQFSSMPKTFGPNDWTPDGAIGDFENYTTVDDTNLFRIHRTALYSLYGVPVL